MFFAYTIPFKQLPEANCIIMTDLLASPEAIEEIKKWDEDTKSTHKVEVVEVNMLPHENADTLSIIPLWGYNYVAKTADWVGVKKAAWCPPDSLVDVTRKEFNFLYSEARFYEDSETCKTVLRKAPPLYARIKAKRLRGVVSYGLLVPLPDDAVIGEDYAAQLGVKHYVPPEGGTKNETGTVSGDIAKAPSGHYPRYDVDSFQRYAQMVFTPGEYVWVSQKIHGENSIYLYDGEAYHCSSHNQWKKEFTAPPQFNLEELIVKVGSRERAEEIIEKANSRSSTQSKWWKVLRTTPSLERFLFDNPGVDVYGEIYGMHKGFPYDASPADIKFVGFDIWKDGRWMNKPEAYDAATAASIPWVSVVHKAFPYDFDALVKMASEASILGNGKNINEGVVVGPLVERYNHKCGRVQLKIVSPEYFNK